MPQLSLRSVVRGSGLANRRSAPDTQSPEARRSISGTLFRAEFSPG